MLGVLIMIMMIIYLGGIDHDCEVRRIKKTGLRSLIDPNL